MVKQANIQFASPTDRLLPEAMLSTRLKLVPPSCFWVYRCCLCALDYSVCFESKCDFFFFYLAALFLLFISSFLCTLPKKGNSYRNGSVCRSVQQCLCLNSVTAEGIWTNLPGYVLPLEATHVMNS